MHMVIVRSRHRLAVRLAGAATLLLSVPAAGQIQASPRSTVSQVIDGTTITVNFSRPLVRGREIFGGLVPWNVVWTPGANFATTLEFDRAIRLNGVEVPAGKYSVWSIPRPDRFTITLNPEWRIFHAMKPDSTAEQIHIAVTPEPTDHMEMLTWSFPHVRGDAAILRLAWATTAVPLEVVVQPTRPLVLDSDECAKYVGRYAMTFVEGVTPQQHAELVIFEENGKLRGRLPFPIHPDDEIAWDLVPAGDGRFNAGLYRGDALFNVEQGVGLDFDVENGRATVLRIALADGFVRGEGVRVK
jgi:hypothetical protein